MALDEETLEAVAKDGSMDFEKWPGLLDPLLERLEQIVHHEFPLPRIPQNSSYETVQTVPLASPSRMHEMNSQTNSNKENAPPSQLRSPPRPPPVPLFSSPSSTERVPDSQPPSGPADDALPPALFALLSSIKSTLKTCFSINPPHTIQRLAELVLRPTSHYRTLPAYLRAIDRVVTVSSGADIFPLPRTTPLPGTIDGTGLDPVNGAGTTNFMLNDTSLGSDESLGGALLTPIPWVNNSTVPEEGGEAFAEPDVGPITQDEHMHQEQESEANPAATSQPAQQQPLTSSTRGQSPDSEEGEEIPHARGPPVLGVEDLGLQDGKGVEMNLDTSAANSNSVSSDDNNASEGQAAPAELDADADGDVVIADALDKGETQAAESKGSAPELAGSEGA